MKFIDLFSGIGGFRSGLEKNGHKAVAYSEVDKYAKQSYTSIYETSEELDLGDITKVSNEQWQDLKGKANIIVGGSPCFRKGTLITTKEGLKPIEDIKKGDYVLTHNNRYKEVVVPMVNPAKEIYSLKVEKNVETFVTPEHPIRVKEVGKNENKWVKVKDLNKDKHHVQLGNFKYSHIEKLQLLSTDETVYNFEVEDDNSYVANNMVVHNCQSFSLAGKRRGFEDTRGTLFFHYVNAIKEVQPEFFIFENVKGMMSHDKGETIKTVLSSFNEIGYDIDFDVFNSKYYGVPQNRERIYIVGKRKDLGINESRESVKGKKKLDQLKNWAIENINYVKLLPENNNENVEKRLVDVLEDKVDEKYYLSEEKTKKLTLNLDLTESKKSDIAIKQVGNIVDNKETFGGNPQRGRVYNSEGLSPALNCMRGGGLEPKIAVREATKQGYAIAEQGDSVNVTYPDSKTRRGRVGKQVAQTLQAGEVNQGVVMNDIRIRKLSPLECWRLQGFTDEQFYKAKDSGVSNSQLYKQAGNAVTVNVVDAITKELFKHGLK